MSLAEIFVNALVFGAGFAIAVIVIYTIVAYIADL